MHHVVLLFAAINIASLLALWGHIPAPAQALILTGACALLVKYVALIPGPTQRFFTFLEGLIGHIKSPIVRALLSRLDSCIRTAALWGEQVLIGDIKARLQNGTLAPADLPKALADAKADVTTKVKSLLTGQGLLNLVLFIVFGGKVGALDDAIGTGIEAHVGTLPPAGLQALAVSSQAQKAAPAVTVTVVPPVPAAG